MQTNSSTHERIALSLLEVVVVIAILGILFGLSLGALQSARQASQKVSCQNKLRQIGLGLILHHDTQGALPPGWQRGKSLGIPFTTWMVNILPFVGETSLHKKIAANPFSFPYDCNYFALALPVKTYLCPEDLNSQGPGIFPPFHGLAFEAAYTDYLGVCGIDRWTKDGLLFMDSQIRFPDIKDGASHTLLVGERPPSLDRTFGLWFTDYAYGDGAHNSFNGVREYNIGGSTDLLLRCPWNVPTPYQEPKSLEGPCSYLHFWSFHSGGANFLLADGSVHFIPYKAAHLMSALATRAGGEPASDF